MDSKLLMIGDWVLVNGIPMQIQAIDAIDDEIMAGDELYCLIEDRVHSEDKVEPIPLTAEILEKNGFKHHLIAEKGFKREEWTLSDDYYDIVVSEWSDSIWVFRYDCTEMNTPHEQRTFSYVHNLQHALRECGIDKEIVL